MDIQERLDLICKNRQIEENGTNVTISKDDFLWLVYGVQEQTEKIERYKKSLKEIVDIVKLDAFAFHEICAKVYEKAIETLGEDEI